LKIGNYSKQELEEKGYTKGSAYFILVEPNSVFKSDFNNAICYIVTIRNQGPILFTLVKKERQASMGPFGILAHLFPHSGIITLIKLMLWEKLFCLKRVD